MKKIAFVIAAVVAIAAPSIASAETIVVRQGGGHHWDHSRAEFRGHREWHPHRDRVVIIRGHRHHGW